VTGRSTGALPTVIIIGAPKSGTSALHAYLAAHPEVSMSSPKELDFFIAERNWSRGLHWYRAHFDPTCAVRGESSPNYTSFPTWSGVPERMAGLVPEAKLIYLVRDPIERITSQYLNEWAGRREGRAPADALKATSRYVVRTRYMFQLDQFLARYPAERILVLDHRDLLEQRYATLERVFRFLGVDPSFRDGSLEVEVNTTRSKRRISPIGAALRRRVRRSPLDTRLVNAAIVRLERLVPRPPLETPDIPAALAPETLDLLREDAARLRAFTGMPLDRWSV
jgi:hypothetical protein